MDLASVLTVDRVSVAGESEGLVRDKPSALSRLADMLATGAAGVPSQRILDVLTAREAVQSTGVGGGVAVPHGAIDALDRQIAALLLCPTPIAFDAIDGEPVNIIFALIGPTGAPAQHLKILARISRLLRHASFRQGLREAKSGRHAFDLIVAAEDAGS